MNASDILDPANIRIACLLGENGRLSNREVARRLGISEGTVRQRLARLMAGGVLRVKAQVNLENLPETFLAIVGVKIDGRHLNPCAERIETLPSVLTTSVVTGRYDLIAVILATSRQTLVDFVTRELAKVPGVKDSETFVVLRSFGQWVDADKTFDAVGERGRGPARGGGQ